MQAISNEELENRFDEGEDVTPFMDMSTVRRPNLERAASQVTLSIPYGMAREIERAAARVGVSREALLNVWIAERLDEESRVAMA